MTAPAGRHVDAGRLSAWISGDLPERDVVVVRAHVESCKHCMNVAGDVRAQVVATRGLERPEPPPTLWSAIEGALDQPSRRIWPWRATLIGALAGVTVALVVVGGLTVRARVGGQSGGPGPLATQAQSQAQSQSQSGSRGQSQSGSDDRQQAPAQGPTAAPLSDPLLIEAERELERAAVSYEQAVNRLRKILDREQVLWDPEIRARVGERLARLDDAVAHSRAVARRDPGDSAGADMLFSAYQRQIQFLAEAVRRGSPADTERLR